MEIFERHHVRSLLVGGVAARPHGATRPTEDIDVLPADDDENLRHLAAAPTELGAFLRVGGLSDDEARALPVQLDGATLRGMDVSTWRTTAGDLDVLRSLRDADGGRRSYVELEQRSLAISTNDVEIRLAGLGDIIDSKRFADREKDHDALPELEALRAAATEGDESRALAASSDGGVARHTRLLGVGVLTTSDHKGGESGGRTGTSRSTATGEGSELRCPTCHHLVRERDGTGWF